MRKYDYSFLKKDSIPGSLINILTSLYTSRDKNDVRKQKFSSVFNSLEKVAIIQSVKGSNEIEGIITTDERINAIVNENSAPLNHSEQEIAGYKDCLNLIHTEHNLYPFDEKTILSLHKKLIAKADPYSAGKYKEKDNFIAEILPDGRRSARFVPVPAKEVKESMNQFILAYFDAANDSIINPLLLIPCVILDFLCIHPFSDGNGRLSRLLSSLLLYSEGFDAGKYVSFEEEINKTKSSYYEALKKSSLGWQDNKNDYFPFVHYFLITLMTCYLDLDSRFATLKSKKISKTNRIEATVLNSVLPLSKAQIAKILPDVSSTTIEAVLSAMLKKGEIRKIGSTKNATYLKAHQ